MASEVVTRTIETDIPARLDRLPWAKFHWLVVFGLGTAWVLDGLEVTLVGSVAGRMTESGSGISISSLGIGIAAAVYVAGATSGALFWGQLTDRYGRKKLFMITLCVYIVAVIATAFSFNSPYFWIARFFTGFGIGGEYAAINSAIDELIPARVRGRVDLIINGSYWIGAVGGAAAAIFFLDEAFFPKDIGWRLAWFLGASLAVAVLLVRRNVPESPRWLFIHGREEEAESIVNSIEERTRKESGGELEAVDKTIKVRQRESFPFREIARTAFKLYPRRTILGLALFVGQAFMYNGIVFNLGGLFGEFFKVESGFVPVLIIIWAAANFLGPVALGRLFDTVGRKPMITLTYIGSSCIGVVMTWLFIEGSLTTWTMEMFLIGIFFLASAGASAAYLTVSEIFPMETRALAIAFFYAVGTAAGGITGPLVFSSFIETGSRSTVAIAFLIGIGLMALGGLAEVLFGVKAERQQLEDIAEPLTVSEAEGSEARGEGEGARGEREGADAGAAGRQAALSAEHELALERRRSAIEQHARAAEHRALAHELRARAIAGDRQASEQARTEEALAGMIEMRAQAMEEHAAVADERDASRRARRGEGIAAGDGGSVSASVEVHEAWADVHEQWARVFELKAERQDREADEAEMRAKVAEEGARVAEQRAEIVSNQHGDTIEGAEAQRYRQLAVGHRERAAERRARIVEMRTLLAAGDGQVAARIAEEEALAEIADLSAEAMEERASAEEEMLAASHPDGEEAEKSRVAALERAAAAQQRAQALEHRAAEMQAEGKDAQRHSERAAAAEERARSREQRGLAEEARSEAGECHDAAAAAASARVHLHEAWAEAHEQRAKAHELRADGDERAADAAQRQARASEERAHAAEERAAAADRLAEADALKNERAGAPRERERQRAQERQRREHEARSRERSLRQQNREQRGLRRFRLGPGSGYAFYSPGMVGTFGETRQEAEDQLDREIDAIARALDERGTLDRRELAREVGARYWGPGRFSYALREAIDSGRVRRGTDHRYAASKAQR